MPLFNPTSGEYNVGLWKAVNVPASSPGVNMGRLGVTAVDNFWVADKAGFIVGLSADMSAAVTAGTFTVFVEVEGVGFNVAGSILQVTNVAPVQFKANRLTNPVPVAAGNRVTMRVATDAGALPLTLDPVTDFRFRPV